MSRAGFTVRRPAYEIDYSRKPVVRKDPVQFAGVPTGSLFYLRDPDIYICLTFIKTGPRMAELYTWDDNAPRQSFPDDYLVYIADQPIKRRTP